MKNVNFNRFKVLVFDIVSILVGFGMLILGFTKSVYIVSSPQDAVLLGIFMILFGNVLIGNDL